MTDKEIIEHLQKELQEERELLMAADMDRQELKEELKRKEEELERALQASERLLDCVDKLQEAMLLFPATENLPPISKETV